MVDGIVKRMVDALINAVRELGPVKALMSRKATVTLAAVGAIWAWTKQSMEEGWPLWVTVAGMFAVAIIGAAYVLAQGMVDKADMETLPNVMEVNRRSADDEHRRMAGGERGFLLLGTKHDVTLWAVLALLFGLVCLAFAHGGCSEEDDNANSNVPKSYTLTKFGDAIACFADSVTQVPQLWGIYQVTNQTDQSYYTTEVRIVGTLCDPVTEFFTVKENGTEVVKEIVIGENCTRQVLDMEPSGDTDCLEVTGGAQADLDVYVYPVLWYPLELKGEQFPHKAGGTKTYSLVRNEVPSLIGEDQKVYPDCAPYYDECYTGADCGALIACCDDRTVFENQRDVGTCALVNGGIIP